MYSDQSFRSSRVRSLGDLAVGVRTEGPRGEAPGCSRSEATGFQKVTGTYSSAPRERSDQVFQGSEATESGVFEQFFQLGTSIGVLL